MKTLLALLLTSLSLLAAGPVTPKQVWFVWRPDPADFGGMTTNQYYTNIVFNLYSVTDCTTPTNAWPVVTNWAASTFPSYNGYWTNYFNADSSTRFFLMSVGVANGNSPFSNLAVFLPIPAPGIIQRVGP